MTSERLRELIINRFGVESLSFKVFGLLVSKFDEFDFSSTFSIPEKEVEKILDFFGKFITKGNRIIPLVKNRGLVIRERFSPGFYGYFKYFINSDLFKVFDIPLFILREVGIKKDIFIDFSESNSGVIYDNIKSGLTKVKEGELIELELGYFWSDILSRVSSYKGGDIFPLIEKEGKIFVSINYFLDYYEEDLGIFTDNPFELFNSFLSYGVYFIEGGEVLTFYEDFLKVFNKIKERREIS